MANYTGQSGVLKLDTGANTLATIAEVRSFSIDHTVGTVEDTTMGDQYRTFKTNLNEWSGSADIYLDDTAYTQYGNVLVGNSAGANDLSSLTIEAYPGGNTAGYPKLSGEVFVTGFSVKAAMDGMAEGTISFKGTGALTFGTGA